MTIRRAVSTFSRFLLKKRFFRNLQRYYFSNNVFFMMLHRVSPINHHMLFSNEHMKVSPQYLEDFILDCKKKGYQFISIDDFYHHCMGTKSIQTPAIVMTMDDGYKDNLEYGFPIFEKHAVPVIIYLSGFYIGKKELPWWYELEQLLLDKNCLRWAGKECLANTLPLKDQMFLEIRQSVLENDHGDKGPILHALYRDNGFLPAEELLFLDWDEVMFLSKSPLVTLGNHGWKHLNLCRCNESAIQQEFLLVESAVNKYLKGKRLLHYCYPYGCHSNEVLRILRSIGACTAVTTEKGVVSQTKEQHKLLTLPRFMLNEGSLIEDILIEATCASLKGVL